MKSLFLAGVATVAMLFMSSDTAYAQCGYGGVRYGGYGYGGGISLGYTRVTPRSSFSIGFGYPGYGYSGYYGYRAPRRGHYDYYPPSYVPHGNHFDYVPGHYHWHRGHHHH